MSQPVLTVDGTFKEIYQSVRVSDKFTKREFVLEIKDTVGNNIIINFALMQCTNTKCSELDKYRLGDKVKVSFNIRGTKWAKDGKERYFSNLEAWKIEKAN